MPTSVLWDQVSLMQNGDRKVNKTMTKHDKGIWLLEQLLQIETTWLKKLQE